MVTSSLEYVEIKKWLCSNFNRYYVTCIWNQKTNSEDDSIKEIVITGYIENNIIIGVGHTFYDAFKSLQDKFLVHSDWGEKVDTV